MLDFTKTVFVDLKATALRGRADTRKRGPWLYGGNMTAREYDAYLTGVHRQAHPGSANRRLRRYAAQRG